jgi:endoglycosylceramidase
MPRSAAHVATLAISGCALVAAGCGDETAPPLEPTGWHVREGFLRAPDGRTVLLRGANVASAHKSAPYFGFHQPADFARMSQEWGFNAVRLLILWAAIEPERGSYDETYLDEVALRLDWAADAGLWVVLDMHQDLYGEGFGGDGAPRWTCDEARYQAFEPVEPWFLNYLSEHVSACIDGFWNDGDLRGHYIEAWRRVATRFAAHPAVVGFDPMNEPQWGSAAITGFEATTLQPFYEEVVAAVRAEAPDWIAFIEPSGSRNAGLPTGLTTFSFGDVVYAPHSYNAQAEQGAGFDPAHREGLIANVAALAGEAAALGAALWIGEYGGNAAHPGIVDYMDAQYDAIGAVRAGSAYWAYDRDEGYGLLGEEGDEKPLLFEALVRPYPRLVAGELVALDYDENARRFSLSWISSGAEATTEVAVPPRLYPDGGTVTCDGCDVTPHAGGLTLRVAASDTATTLIIAP